ISHPFHSRQNLNLPPLISQLFHPSQECLDSFGLWIYLNLVSTTAPKIQLFLRFLLTTLVAETRSRHLGFLLAQTYLLQPPSPLLFRPSWIPHLDQPHGIAGFARRLRAKSRDVKNVEVQTLGLLFHMCNKSFS